MDTFAEISCYGSDRPTASKATEEAFREMQRIERLFNKYDKRSEVSRVNGLAGTEEVKISSELFRIIERSIYYSRISEGSFDITVEPQKLGRYKDIILDKERLSVRFRDSDIKIDLGGIAKGYAVDRAKEVLSSYGIENALIDIGGNIFALGSPPGKKAWRIGIQHPRDKNSIAYKLELKDRAVATSGDYERPFHIINPSNGRPAEGVVGVTVVSDSAEKADALSTAVFVMGMERGRALIKSLDGTEAYIFDKDLTLHFCH